MKSVLENEASFQRFRGTLINRQKLRNKQTNRKEQWSLLYWLCLHENSQFKATTSAIKASGKPIDVESRIEKLLADFGQFHALTHDKMLNKYFDSQRYNASEVTSREHIHVSFQRDLTKLTRLFHSDIWHSFKVSTALIHEREVIERFGKLDNALNSPFSIQITAAITKNPEALKKVINEQIDFLYTSIEPEHYLSAYNNEIEVEKKYALDVNLDNDEVLEKMKKSLDVYFLEQAIVNSGAKYKLKVLEKCISDFVAYGKMPKFETRFTFLANWSYDDLSAKDFDRQLRAYRASAKRVIDNMIDALLPEE